ncbi:glycosyltransferase [Candidatus Protochlamydia phocaeensis]|uniref:glycosyltransferase n=1 Tax=Candidatus Protochlamydia phocaeensis TaxID=1414722 RepID=UPI000839845A|nr:glycosyltransferase [Candidatus Protochlamydia phocaeensis]
MKEKEIDVFDAFIDLYERGQWTEALRTIISHPFIAYDALYSKEKKIFSRFANYADACVFKGGLEFKHTCLVLEAICEESSHLKILLNEFLNVIKQEYVLFSCHLAPLDVLKDLEAPDSLKEFFIAFNHQTAEQIENKEGFLDPLPPLYRPLFEKKWQIKKGREQLQQRKPDFGKLIEEEYWIYRQPWHVFSYALPLQPIQIQAGEVPLIFLEPLEGVDYRAFLQPYCQKACILVFQTFAHFSHMLQFTDLQALLVEPHVHLYIMELYPNEQFNGQHLRWDVPKTLQPIFMISSPLLEAALPAFMQALTSCLTQSKKELEVDTPSGNWLFQVAKRMLSSIEAQRYGKSRAMAVSIEQGFLKWYDPHKGPAPDLADLGPLPVDYMRDIIQENNQKRIARAFAPKTKIRLAHIVPQIVDGGHAPTKLLRTLCTFADNEWFDLFVFSSERISDHLLSYPIAPYISPSSWHRGQLTINLLKSSLVSVWIDPESSTYEMAADQLQSQLEQHQIDIAVFHGPDEINSVVASSTDIPIRILFDHGTLPSYPCFDLIILSTEEAYNQNHDAFRRQGMESCVLPFSIDIRQDWEELPFPREIVRLPKDSFIMTTISNHLDNRLTPEMCHAIGEILKRCPEAVYAPIGEVRKESVWRKIFAEYNVNDRVIFLGQCRNPSQYARSMNLYLNEFPFGSGLGILDAMAAGCPVVSMYDEKGPQQARYAATYFGIDYVVRSGKIEDYINLACQLIQDKAMYEKWSKHAIEQYEKRMNTQHYVRQFEKIVEQFIDYYQKRPSTT